MIAGLFTSVVLAAAVPRQPARAYALVIAYNASNDLDVAPLRYADDDGMRYFELFAAYADAAVLLTVADAETQRIHRGLASAAGVPDRPTLMRELGRMFAAMARDRAAGLRTVFYFIYAGHGDVGENREGYINLLGGRFTRQDLYREVLAASTATYNHIIIDSCNSYFMINNRGGWRADRVDGDFGTLLSSRLEDDLAGYPNTGVLLSTSSAQQTHEWSQYAAGVFSHQLRSGLVGTADVNSDGVIEYSEIRAYIAAANDLVDDPQARVNLYGRAPRADLSAPLFDVARLHAAGFVDLGAGVSGKFYLEDSRGVRYADFNKASEQVLRIALLPRKYYYLHHGQRELRLVARSGAHLAPRPEQWQPIRLASRGVTAETFRKELYGIPFGPAFYLGYVSQRGGVPVAMTAPREAAAVAREIRERRPEAGWVETGRWLGLGGTAALAAATAVTGALAQQSYGAIEASFSSTGVLDARLSGELADRRLATNILLATTGAAATATLGMFIWSFVADPDTSAPLTVGLSPGESGLLLRAGGRF